MVSKIFLVAFAILRPASEAALSAGEAPTDVDECDSVSLLQTGLKLREEHIVGHAVHAPPTHQARKGEATRPQHVGKLTSNDDSAALLLSVLAPTPGLQHEVPRPTQGAAAPGHPSAASDRRPFWNLPVSILPFMIGAYLAPYFLTNVNTFWFAVAIWSTSSLVMNLINKVAVNILPLPFTLVVLQMLIADALLLVIVGPSSIVAEINEKKENIWRWSLLVIPFSGMLLTSMVALHEGTVITLLVVRGALPLVTLFLERIALPTNSSPITATEFASLIVILVGTLVYAAADLHGVGSPKALACIGINMVCTVAHRLLERSLLVDPSMRLSFSGASWVNNTVGIIPISCFMLLSGEHHSWAETFASPDLLNLQPLTCIIFSGVVGLSLGYFSIVIQKHVTATSHLVLQIAVKIVTVVAVILLLHEHLTLLTGCGCLLTILGGAWYSFARLAPTKAETRELAPESKPKEAGQSGAAKC